MNKNTLTWTQPKIYVYVDAAKPYFNHGKHPCFAANALSEDGTLLAKEFVASEANARRYLLAVNYGVNDPFGHRKAYDRYYPKGYEIEFVPLRDQEFHKGLILAKRRHEKRETC